MDLLGTPMSAISKALTLPMATGPLAPKRTGLKHAVEGKIVLITGASSGIGAATAVRIGAAGGEVVLVARGREQLEQVAEQIRAANGIAHVYPCDLSDKDSIGRLADDVTADLGGVDILINNAGRSIRRSLELSYDRLHDYERTMALNYFAPVQLMLKLLPGMRERKGGHVINVSSIGVQVRGPRFGAYIASKSALDTLCDAWQAETHPDGVRFTTVHMPLVRTPMIEATTIYDRFPALTPDDASGVLCHAIVHRPRRYSPPMGSLAAFADAVTPQLMDRVRSAGFELFGDSAAAKGKSADAPETVSTQGRVFAEVTRGVHW